MPPPRHGDGDEMYVNSLQLQAMRQQNMRDEISWLQEQAQLVCKELAAADECMHMQQVIQTHLQYASSNDDFACVIS